jgi:hypothetical protein
VLDEIHRLGLDLHLIFNKGAVMVLPTGVTKASGLAAALKALHLSFHNAVGVGDAENDHEFLKICEFSVAVENALPSLKGRVDYVTKKDHGPGVEEIIHHLLRDDLRSISHSGRHLIPIGKDEKGGSFHLPAHGNSLLIAGASGSGKSRFMSGLLEKLVEGKYQACVIDPEGDYEKFEGLLSLGDTKNVPSPDQVLRALRTSEEGVVVNLLGVKLEDRPGYLLRLIPRLHELRAQTGRPHWIVIDEAHHMLHDVEQIAGSVWARPLENAIFITVHPSHICKSVLAAVKTVLTVGEYAQEAMQEVFKAYGRKEQAHFAVQSGEALIYQRGRPLEKIRVDLPAGAHLRHQRKYSEGNLGHDRSFYFRGPQNRLNLRAQNLQIFLQIAEGVDDDTWEHHLKRHDYSKWFREMIKNEDLAREAERIENSSELSLQDSRAGIRECVDRHYTAPAKGHGD